MVAFVTIQVFALESIVLNIILIFEVIYDLDLLSGIKSVSFSVVKSIKNNKVLKSRWVS